MITPSGQRGQDLRRKIALHQLQKSKRNSRPRERCEHLPNDRAATPVARPAPRAGAAGPTRYLKGDHTIRPLLAVAVPFCLGCLLAGTLHASALWHDERLGYSVLHRPITATQFGRGSDVTIILGGMEGDEPVGTYVAERLIADLETHPRLPAGVQVIIVPKVNPDGLARGTRVNANGVDINRNFPTANWTSHAAEPRFNPGPKPASEPETRIVIRLIEELHPCRVISLHAPYHQINIDGPAMPLARVMQQFNHYRITTYIGYPTPGSFGTYAGKERNIPAIDLELPPVSGPTAWAQNKSALIAAIDLPCEPPPARRTSSDKPSAHSADRDRS